MKHRGFHSSLSCVCTRQTLIELTSKISLPLRQPSKILALSFSVLLLILHPCSQPMALPLFLLPSLFFSFSLSPLLPTSGGGVAGWSVTLLSAQQPVARWWFIAEESWGLGDEVGGWLGLKSLVAVCESEAWWMNIVFARQSKRPFSKLK